MTLFDPDESRRRLSARMSKTKQELVELTNQLRKKAAEAALKSPRDEHARRQVRGLDAFHQAVISMDVTQDLFLGGLTGMLADDGITLRVRGALERFEWHEAVPLEQQVTQAMGVIGDAATLDARERNQRLRNELRHRRDRGAAE